MPDETPAYDPESLGDESTLHDLRVLVIGRDAGSDGEADALGRDDDFRVEYTRTPAEALDHLREESRVDCVVAPRSTLPEAIGEFVSDVRAASPETPVVLADWDGDEYLTQRVHRRVAERRALSHRDGFRQAVEHAGHVIMITARDGTIEYVNPAFEETTGYESAEVVGRRPSVLKSGIHDDEFYADLWGTILDGDVWEGQILNERKSGELYPVEQTIAPIERKSGRVERFVAVNRDVSRELKRKAQLEHSRKKYRSLIDLAPDPIVVTDAETGEIVEVNRATIELTGRSESDLVGADHTELHPPDEREPYRRLFADHVEADKLARREFPDGSSIEVVDADGGTTPVEVTGRTIRIDGQTLFQRIFRDVSHREAHEAELRRQNERLESFAHTVAHDLRNPLNVAQGQLELARETGEAKFFENAEQATNRMERLIEEVLELAKQGRTVLETEFVALGDLSDDAWELVDAPEATLEVEANPRLLADEGRLCELLENLFANATEHAGPDATVRVGALPDGFYVEDDGPGIPADRRDRVFESGHTTSDRGTGFGLAIVDQIVTAHGWEVSVTEGTEGGARFEVSEVERPD